MASALGEGELCKMFPVRFWLQSWNRSNRLSPAWASTAFVCRDYRHPLHRWDSGNLGKPQSCLHRVKVSFQEGSC